MGGQRLTTSTSHFSSVEENDKTLVPFSVRFDNDFPYYLSIGMSYDEFWNMDATLVKAYRKADQLKLDRKNFELWLQGMYTYEAILDASPILHAFAKRGTKPIPYSKEPYKLREDKEEIRARRKRAEMRDKMEKFASRFNKQFKQRKED